MKEWIEKARKCRKSDELYALAEQLSHAWSDATDGRERAEYDYNWHDISHYVRMEAYWKYLYKTVYDWASEMEDEEHEIQLSAEIDAEMMGDRV